MLIAIYMKHDKSQVVLYQLLYVWIKCSKFCKHFPIYFYTSQNWKINQSINQSIKLKGTSHKFGHFWGMHSQTKIGVQL